MSFSTVFNNYFIPPELYDLVESTEKEQKDYSILRGDVFVTRTSETSNELGMSCVALKDYPNATYNGFTKRMRPKNPERVLPEYIGYYMRLPSFRGEFQAFSTMTTRASLRNEDLLSLTVLLPTADTQKRIADILLSYDKLIENNQKQKKLLEEAVQRLYKEWFVDLRFPGHENTPIIDCIPEGWRKDSVNSIISLLSGFAFKSDSFTDDGKYKLVTIKNVQDGFFDGENVNHISEIPTKVPEHCYLNNGDILLSLTGNVGRVCLVVGENYLLNQRVAKLQSIYPSYTYCLFRNKDMFDIINNLANGAAQQNLSPIKTGEVKIIIPNEALLLNFERIVSPLIKNIINLNRQNIKLKQARDRLLPKLMSGELEV